MTTHKIEITKTLSRIIEIEALSAEEAVDITRKMYRNEEIVLDRYDCVDIKIIDLENKWNKYIEKLFTKDNFIMLKEEAVLSGEG